MAPDASRHAEIEPLCAVVLAGGRSRRMGVNKALIRIRGTTLVERALREARQITPEVLLSTNDPLLRPGVPFVRDRYAGQGLAGLHAAMVTSHCPLFLLLACDLPNVTAPLLRALVSRAHGFDAVVPCTSEGLPHPACAVYRRRSCLSRVEANLEHGDNRMTSVLQDRKLRVRWLLPSEGTHTDFDLANANTPADLDFGRGSSSGEAGPGS